MLVLTVNLYLVPFYVCLICLQNPHNGTRHQFMQAFNLLATFTLYRCIVPVLIYLLVLNPQAGKQATPFPSHLLSAKLSVVFIGLLSFRSCLAHQATPAPAAFIQGINPRKIRIRAHRLGTTISLAHHGIIGDERNMLSSCKPLFRPACLLACRPVAEVSPKEVFSIPWPRYSRS